MTKKFVSVLLVFSMLLSMPITVFADDSIEDVGPGENAFDTEAHDSQVSRKYQSLMSLFSIASFTEDSVELFSLNSDTQTLGNEYIEFHLDDSSESENSGRFTIGNTGGNPTYASDDGQILLFGHPSPWSSYTTVRINNTNYIFKAEQTTFDSVNQKATSSMTVENVVITQTLQIIKNSGTNLNDTVQISYTAQNRSGTAKNIGIRIMLDTMLGSNDGAPFKVPSVGNVTREKELVGNAIPQYWQAFDSLTNASVFAVGTLYQGNDRKPDKVQFTAWGNVYDSTHAWSYTVDPQNEVTYDSAVSIYWNPIRVAANASTTVNTYYGVGYTDTGTSATVANAEIPSNGFSVMVVDENSTPISGATVTANNVLGHPSVPTDASGIAVFNAFPSGSGDVRTANLRVEKTGYQSMTAEREVTKGASTAVTIFEDDGKAHISSVIGTLDGTSIDLLSHYKYFKANSSDIDEADDKSNVKTFEITVNASGDSVVDRYQLIQGGKIVAESITSTISIPVLTGTPSNPTSFGSDWRIDKLKAGEVVYLRVVDSNGNASDRKALGIRVSEPTIYGAGDKKGSLKFGEQLAINVPSNVPIIGDTEIKLGWNGLPFEFEVEETGKVKFVVNPPKDGPYKEEDWANFKEDYDFAKEMRQFSSKPLKYGAGKISVDANVMGYGEGYIDDNGNIRVDVGLVITISEKGSYTWTFFLGYVPVYVSLGEKVSLTGKGELSVICSNGSWNVSGAVGEVNPKITLNVDGGVGANGVLSIGASGRATLSWLNRWTDNYNKVDLTGGMYLVAQAFLFKAEKKLAEGTWTIYDSYNRNRMAMAVSQSLILNANFYDGAAYTPIDRSYLDTPMLMALDPNTVKANVYPGASPKLVQVGNTAYLFWLEDIPTRADNDRTALVYSTSTDFETWSAPVQVIAESADSTADFAYDAVADGNKIHIALSKANRQFGNTDVTLDEMASSANVYHISMDTTVHTISIPQALTDNDYSNTMPSVVVNNGQVVVSYAENQMEDGFFGANNTHNVCSTVVGGATTKNPVSGLVTALSSGVIGGDSVVAYIVDSDNNYNTEEDTELWVAASGGATQITNDEVGEFSPTFANIDGADTLLWYSNGNINYVNSVGGTVGSVFDEDVPSTVSNSFYVIGDGASGSKIIWNALPLNDDNGATNIYASAYESGEWSAEYLLFEIGSDMTSPLSGYTVGNTDYIAYLNTTNMSNDTQIADLKVAAVEPQTDIALIDINYKQSDVSLGESLPMTLTIQNNGGSTVETIDFLVGADSVATISGANLKRGETKTYDVTGYSTPLNLNGLQTLTASIQTPNDINISNNSLEFSIGYTDVGVTANQLLVNGDDWASISVTNESDIPTNVTLRIIADEKNGAVLYEQTLANVSRDDAQVTLLNLNELGGEADIHAFYATVAPDKDEIVTSNNSDLIYLGLGSTTKYSLTISAGNGGTISTGTSGLYAEGENVAMSAVADTGYEFVNWTSTGGGSFDNASSANTNYTMPAGDASVVANFKSSSVTPTPISPSYSDSDSGSDDSSYNVTVPVSGGNSVSISASISGSTASLANLSTEQLNKLTRESSGMISFDLSGLSRDITTAKVPTETIKAIAQAVNDPKIDADTLEIRLTDGAVIFDSVTLNAIVDQAKGGTVQLTLDSIKETGLRQLQRSAIESMDVQAIYSIYLTSNNNQITNFKGGKAIVSIPYALKTGQKAAGVTVWYIADNGEKAQMDGSYSNGNESWPVNHFSNYVIAYNEERAAVCPQDATCPIGAFADASATAWYHDGVHWALENKIMSGMGNGLFAPNSNTSRAMVATMLWRLEGSPVVNYAMNFSDVETDMWYTESIRWANASGIITGYSGKFAPNDAVTREQLAAMLWRYAKYKGVDVSVGEDTNILSYGDAFDVSEYAVPAIQWACGAGIINGYTEHGGQVLGPQRASSRAVVATVLMRYCTKITK